MQTSTKMAPQSTIMPKIMPKIEVIWKLAPNVSVGQALHTATLRLREEAIETASLDAQVLLAHLLGVDRSWLFAHHDSLLSATQAESYTKLVVRRMLHEPVAYLIGHKEFYGIDLLVDPRVLIPRPETELLVDAVLDEINSIQPASGDTTPREWAIADVGTGSGAIALSLAVNCERAHIYAIDFSLDALMVASANIQQQDHRHQIRLLQGDLLSPLPEQVDLVVANLPYVAAPVYPTLDATVRNYEPRFALEAGVEGLDTIANLLKQVPQHIKHPGKVFLEIGHDQGPRIRQLTNQLLPQAKSIQVEQDYMGHDRIVKIEL